MKKRLITTVIATAATLAWQSQAQIYDTNNVVVQTFAGSGFSGYVDGVGQLTMFDNPSAIVADSLGNVFVWDGGNSRIRKITPNGTVSTFAGGGNQTTGTGTNVAFPNVFNCMATDRNDKTWAIFNSSSLPNYLYEITGDATITRTSLPTPLAGGPTTPSGISVDTVGNIYISDSSGNKIYVYRTNAVLEVFAGSGNSGSADGNGVFTSFRQPGALAADAADNIYVWDSGNYKIRRINQNRDVETITGGSSSSADGTNPSFSSVFGMSVDSLGNLILACELSVRKMSVSTNSVTMAGSFTQSGYTNGTGNLARFYGARGVCVAQGTVFVADRFNHRIRTITFNPSPQPVLPANLQLSTFAGLQIVGTVGRTYRVESSPDTTNWTTQATLLLTSSPYLWIDQNPVSGNKFYRAWLLP